MATTYLKLEDFKKLSDEEFYNSPPMPGDCYEKSILYPIEVARRQRLHQHELDLKLLHEQSKMMKSSNRLIAIVTILAALIGAITGAVLQDQLTQKTQVTTPKK